MRSSAERLAASSTASRLEDAGVRLLMTTIVDNSGVTRVKTLPVDRVDRAAQYGIGLSMLFAVFGVNDQVTSSPGFETPSGDFRVRPDLEAMTVLADPAGWAWAPADQYTQELEPAPTCQRDALKRAVGAAAAAGIAFRAAYELEFMLFHEDSTPVHDGPSFSVRALWEAEAFCLDLIEALTAQNIRVEQLHPEYSIGQFELSIAAASPLEAADAHVLVRLTITRIAKRHGFKVSFAPVAIHDVVGNGRHLHLSAWRDGRNLMSGGDAFSGLTDDGEALIAGMLDHVVELMAVLAPSVVSYERLQPHRFAAPYACWGPENREAVLRLIRGTVGIVERAANVEVKAVDGASNPYLALAVVIAAALDGLERRLTLPPGLERDPSDISEDEARALGVRRLPLTLGEAIGHFESSSLARSALGDSLFEAFLAVRRLEWDTYKNDQAADTIAAHRWRYG